MYNILIVDDEMYAVDGLFEVLQDITSLNFSIYKAYSGMEALNWLNKTRIDIVITDVCMPNINGMELHEIIIKRWPRCKVIFLSGHDDFKYARTAMRNNCIDYILKGEGDEWVINAVRKALDDINKDQRNEKLILNSQDDLIQHFSELRKELILEILNGRHFMVDDLISRLRKYEILMDVSVPVFLLQGRLDDGKVNSDIENKMGLIYGIRNIVKEYFKESFIMVSVIDATYDLVWILQPKGIQKRKDGLEEEYLWKKSEVTLQNTLDLIQNSCRELQDITVSFVYSSKPCEWKNIGSKYVELKLIFKNMAYGLKKEMILSDNIIEDSKYARNANERTNIVITKIQKYIIDNLDKDISLVTLADLVYLNQSYLSRLFKQTTGIRLSDYIINVKMEKAKELLDQNTIRINEIASMLGFSSHACFSRFFRKYAGVAPHDFRNK
jgi:two-component system response regulator YesN